MSSDIAHVGDSCVRVNDLIAAVSWFKAFPVAVFVDLDVKRARPWIQRGLGDDTVVALRMEASSDDFVPREAGIA